MGKKSKAYKASSGPKCRFKAVFMSDLHLGTRGCQAEPLLVLLENLDVDVLYLVGDIIDFWNLATLNAFWRGKHTKVLIALSKLMKKGTLVVIVPGNHDEVLRRFCSLVFPKFRMMTSSCA